MSRYRSVYLDRGMLFGVSGLLLLLDLSTCLDLDLHPVTHHARVVAVVVVWAIQYRR